jgi:hypothetical protein
MPYVQPTAASFKARYPEFTPVSDALIDLVLLEAIDQVGDTWLERDRARAQVLLTAHKLTLEGEPGRSETGQGAAGTGFIKRDKVGDVETEFATPAAASGSSSSYGGYGGTIYGQEFWMLLKMNFPSPLVV